MEGEDRQCFLCLESDASVLKLCACQSMHFSCGARYINNDERACRTCRSPWAEPFSQLAEWIHFHHERREKSYKIVKEFTLVATTFLFLAHGVYFWYIFCTIAFILDECYVTWLWAIVNPRVPFHAIQPEFIFTLTLIFLLGPEKLALVAVYGDTTRILMRLYMELLTRCSRSENNQKIN